MMSGRCRSRLSKCETNIQNLQQQLQELQVERNQVDNEKIQEINTRVRVETAIKLMTFRLQHPGDPVPNFRPHIVDPEPPTFYEAAFDNTVTAQCVVQLPRCHKNLRSVQKLLQMQKQHVADGRRELEDLRRLTEDERDKARVLAPRLNEMLQSRYEAKYGPIDSN
ncbi:hypothetical protein B566_EDAN012574 [Ephemera danica]|nr:hypothetical protein B566_EDAN012574 [Ephemera danica]